MAFRKPPGSRRHVVLLNEFGIPTHGGARPAPFFASSRIHYILPWKAWQVASVPIHATASHCMPVHR